MEDHGVAVQSVSHGFGIAGFVITLVSIVIGIFIPFVNGLSILGLIFSIIQMKKHRTGLAIAGLVLGIIGVLLFVSQIAVFFIWSSVIPDIKENSRIGGMECLDAISTMAIGSACKDDQGIRITLSKSFGDFKAEQVRFIVGGNYVDKDVKEEEFLVTYSELGVSSAESVEMAPIISSKVCDVSDSEILMDC
ncbi:hypothetical protein CMI37_21240 [Candidatus Pacearchaeota archaeon]|nr:hypothetical protein [Candidatus Pacearchaeota archaeon]|tara:strand:+ start:658 stop:1233 length:576 start_codon:yes stop_codon:yes gene_type:complete